MKRDDTHPMPACGLTGRVVSAKPDGKIGRYKIAERENDYQGCRRRDV